MAETDAANSKAANNQAGLVGKSGLEQQHPKRFYTLATTEQREAGWCILLDGRLVRTPGKNLVSVPSSALADALAREWDGQQDVIDPATMPLTRIVNTAADGVAHKANEVRDEIVKFAGGDLLCYRAEHPQELVERQQAAWDAPLTWLAEAHGVHLKTTSGIMPITQPQPELQKFRSLLENYDGLQLAALHVTVTLTGSAVLGAAALTGKILPEDAWLAAHVDEDWQIAQWGEDDEPIARRQNRQRQFWAASEIIKLVGER